MNSRDISAMIQEMDKKILEDFRSYIRWGSDEAKPEDANKFLDLVSEKTQEEQEVERLIKDIESKGD